VGRNWVRGQKQAIPDRFPRIPEDDLWSFHYIIQKDEMLVMARDGFGQHYTPLRISLGGLILNPAA